MGGGGRRICCFGYSAQFTPGNDPLISGPRRVRRRGGCHPGSDLIGARQAIGIFIPMVPRVALYPLDARLRMSPAEIEEALHEVEVRDRLVLWSTPPAPALPGRRPEVD